MPTVANDFGVLVPHAPPHVPALTVRVRPAPGVPGKTPRRKGTGGPVVAGGSRTDAAAAPPTSR